MKTTLILILCASLAGNVYQFTKGPGAVNTDICRVDVVDRPVVMRTNGGLLEVSTINVSEQFAASVAYSVWGASLGNSVSQIKVPVVYRYHIELAPEWTIRLKEKTFIVIAPAVKPTLPVAIQTAGIKKESSGIWSVLVGNSSLDKLERSISPSLAERAKSPVYVELQREASRRTVKEFVAKWLITQEQWKSAAMYPIHVYFADEPIKRLNM